jgi:hypothetical protein
VGIAILPFDCNSVVIFNSSAVNVLFRTDPNNANSQVTIAPGQAFQILTSGAIGTRISGSSANPMGSLQSSSGSVSVIVESTR